MSLLKKIAEIGGISQNDAEEMRAQGLDPTVKANRDSYFAIRDQGVPITEGVTNQSYTKFTTKVFPYESGVSAGTEKK